MKILHEYDKKWVDMGDLIDRIETICNNGKPQDVRFKNLLLSELKK